jgi:kynureninase
MKVMSSSMSLFPSVTKLALSSSLDAKASLDQSLITNPNQFMQQLMKQSEWFSLETAKKLDALDPLSYTSKMFNIGTLIPFAGHSLGPVFQPALDKIQETANLQIKLHEGHFPNSHPEGDKSGHWFDCDKHKPSLEAAKKVLGFEDDREFIFTASGLSQNLAMLMDTFYRPGKKDWETGKTKIVMLDTEFFSDQAVAASVLKRSIQTANMFGCFDGRKIPEPDSQVIKIKPDEKGLFNTETIIKLIKDNAKNIQMICLSDTVFSTGQRLELNKIFAALQNIIKENQIIVGLDLAHTVGNRMLDLKSLPVTFAVGCGYKHLCGFPGSGLGIYVNKNADLKKYPPLQGWKAADSSQVFSVINQYNANIMKQVGADAFRTSNPAPMSLIPSQLFLTYFNKIGFDKCFNKSECLTRYLTAQLKHHLNDKIEFITPEDPSQRGAMIVFQVKGLTDVKSIEDFLKTEQLNLGTYEIDVRPPNNIRLTPHYAYTKFEQINRMVSKLAIAIDHTLQHKEKIHLSKK